MLLLWDTMLAPSPPHPFQLPIGKNRLLLRLTNTSLHLTRRFAHYQFSLLLALTLLIRFMVRKARLNRLELGVALFLYIRCSYNRLLAPTSTPTSLATFVCHNTTIWKLSIITENYNQLYYQLYIFF